MKDKKPKCYVLLSGMNNILGAACEGVFSNLEDAEKAARHLRPSEKWFGKWVRIEQKTIR